MSVRKLIKESAMNIENKIVKICDIGVIDKNIARRQSEGGINRLK
jgi:hypothetical protein